MEIKVMKEEEETIMDEEFFTEEAVRSRVDEVMKEVTNEQLDRFGMDRDYFRDVLISFGESFGKPCKKLDMEKVEKLYIELTKELEGGKD